MKPLALPNLPDSTVTHVIVSPLYDCVVSQLEKLGITALKTSFCRDVLEPVALHADMLVHHIGGNKIIAEKSQQGLIDELTVLGFEFPFKSVALGSEYPQDVKLNCCCVGESIICNEKAANKNIIAGKKIINTNQGYAKCSVCVVDERSIITEDLSIAAACACEGFDVLTVRKGFVDLDGFDCGFFGGCCGKLANDTLAFCGDISEHPDYDKIKSYADERGVRLLSLFGGRLLDIGSIIPIMQK